MYAGKTNKKSTVEIFYIAGDSSFFRGFAQPLFSA